MNLDSIMVEILLPPVPVGQDVEGAVQHQPVLLPDHLRRRFTWAKRIMSND
jgi:hypothetical protein